MVLISQVVASLGCGMGLYDKSDPDASCLSYNQGQI